MTSAFRDVLWKCFRKGKQLGRKEVVVELHSLYGLEDWPVDRFTKRLLELKKEVDKCRKGE